MRDSSRNSKLGLPISLRQVSQTNTASHAGSQCPSKIDFFWAYARISDIVSDYDGILCPTTSVRNRYHVWGIGRNILGYV